MNYLISMAVCVAATVFSALGGSLLGGSLEVKYLIMSDVNVAVFLLIAWGLDAKRIARNININMTVRRGE